MFVTVKVASSLDGRIATASGESRWITGEAARAAVHRLRAKHDAVLVGVETALADDPQLTVRFHGYDGPQPTRVVLDSRQRLTETCKLVATARDIPTYVVSIEPPQSRLTSLGVQVLQVEAAGERPDLHTTLKALSAQGINRLFVEGGGQVTASFIRCGLVDVIEWFRAPVILGGEGRPAIGSLAVETLADAPKFKRVAAATVGEDLWERYEKL